MGSDDRQEIIDRALKALAAPELREAKASRAIEEVLVEARTSGSVKLGRLQQGVEALVVETGASKYLERGAQKASGDAQKSSHDSDSDEFSSLFALFFLLILLLLLASRADPGSDAAALLDELIQQLLDLLKGGS